MLNITIRNGYIPNDVFELKIEGLASLKELKLRVLVKYLKSEEIDLIELTHLGRVLGNETKLEELSQACNDNSLILFMIIKGGTMKALELGLTRKRKLKSLSFNLGNTGYIHHLGNAQPVPVHSPLQKTDTKVPVDRLCVTKKQMASLLYSLSQDRLATDNTSAQPPDFQEAVPGMDIPNHHGVQVPYFPNQPQHAPVNMNVLQGAANNNDGLPHQQAPVPVVAAQNPAEDGRFRFVNLFNISLLFRFFFTCFRFSGCKAIQDSVLSRFKLLCACIFLSSWAFGLPFWHT